MCLASPHKTESADPAGWKQQDGGNGKRWRDLMFPVGKERWGKFREWGRSNLVGMEQTVALVTTWVFNLELNFTLLSLPILFTGFLTILSPHTDIQACVCGSVLSVLLCLLNKHGWMDPPVHYTDRIGLTRLFRRQTKVHPDDLDFQDQCYQTLSLRMRTYKVLPLNQLSRVWGRAADTELPTPFKFISVWLFATLMRCDRTEAEFDCLSQYRTISQFFRRKLKPGLRPVCPVSSIVSPADGSLTYIGLVQGSYLEQIKGIRYCLKQFFGPFYELDEDASKDPINSILSRTQIWDSDSVYLLENQILTQSPEVYQLLHYPGRTALFQAVIYLSPSDYHRFHSPTAWTVHKRRHFPGKLYSVSPSVVRKMPGLFHTNERVALFGEWQHGFFSMTAVGATNVGSIVMNFDNELMTNLRGSEYSEKIYEDDGISIEKGEEMGFFNFGSTIVLVFEAPIDYQFRKESMTRVKVGEGM